MPQAVAPPPPVATSRTVIAGTVGTAAAAASVADQVDQLIPTIELAKRLGTSVQSLFAVGTLALSVVALGAMVYVVVRYIRKRNSGQVAIQ